MTESALAAGPALSDPESRAALFASLEATLTARGAPELIDRLIAHLDEKSEYRALLDALLLKARYQLGLPTFTTGSLSALPEPERTQYEEKYVDAIRLVGSRYLDAGDIPTAWAYFRAIAENEPVARAIRNYQPTEADERLGAIIEVAFNHGVDPEHGFELILAHYGTCPAITAFEQLPSHDGAIRAACAARLIDRVHHELSTNIRSEIAAKEGTAPPEGTSVTSLIEERAWIFADEAYHIDISHLASVVRMSLLLADRDALLLAVDLTEYGRRLAPRLLFDGPPPFEKIFEDHGIYLRGLLGNDVDRAVAHFQGKLPAVAEEYADATMPAQVLVNLLVHVGRLDDAIDVAATHLVGIPDSALACPSLTQLCTRAGRSNRLAAIARDQGDAVTFTAALLEALAAQKRA